TVDAAHPAEPRNRADARRTAEPVDVHQPDRLLRQVRALAEEVAHDLWPLRPHVPAGILHAGGWRILTMRPRHDDKGTALRALLAGRDALQVHGRLAHLAL